jgi:hypothetical protein
VGLPLAAGFTSAADNVQLPQASFFIHLNLCIFQSEDFTVQLQLKYALSFRNTVFHILNLFIVLASENKQHYSVTHSQLLIAIRIF